MASQITIDLSLSLTGAYAAMGRQALAALRLFVADTNGAGGLRLGKERHELALRCEDDRSDPSRCAEIYRSICFENPCGLIFGPYSSRLLRAAAPICAEAGRLLINHGGAADEIHDGRERMIVSVLSSASDYMVPFVRLVSMLKLWRKRLAIIAAPTPFARDIAGGVERACAEKFARRRGVRVRVKYNASFDPDETPSALLPALRRNRINAVVSAGSYAHDVEAMRAIIDSDLSIPVLACVAAGVENFGADLGEHADGIVGPSQWEESLNTTAEIGPTPGDFARRMRASKGADACDYVAAQAYAAGLVAAAAIQNVGSLDSRQLRAAFSDLRTTTLFGDFAIDRVTGRQIGHKMLLVQWHRGRKIIIEPGAHADRGSLDFPSGWRLIAAGIEMLRLNRGRQADAEDIENQDTEDAAVASGEKDSGQDHGGIGE